MQLTNTRTSFSMATRVQHWATVLGIAVLVSLDLIAGDMAQELRAAASPDPDMLARAGRPFSAHKTLGLAVLLLAVLRILWALSQPRPGLLNADKPAEARLAETVHWLV